MAAPGRGTKTPASSSVQWEELFASASALCDAVRVDVLASQDVVRAAIVPRLDGVKSSFDACDVTLRGILRALHQSARDDNESETALPMHDDVSGASDPASTQSIPRDRVKEQSVRTRHPLPSSSPLDAVEAKLESLARQVELQRRSFERESARQRRELQQVRDGVTQMEECKGQLLHVLRQLQLDKAALLRLCVQHDEEEAQALPMLTPRPQSQSPIFKFSSGRPFQDFNRGDASANVTGAASHVASLEATVNGLELLMEQEREARAAQVQELSATLHRLENLQRMRERHYTHAAGVASPTSQRADDGYRARATDIFSGGVPDAALSYPQDSSWPATALTEEDSFSRGTNRKLRYPVGSVASPATASEGMDTDTRRDAREARAEKEAAATERAVLLRDRLLRFYAIYDPRMIPAVAEVVREFKGPEEDLLAALEVNYKAYGYFSHD